MLQHGAYRLLLDECYLHDGRMTGDHKILHRVCGAHTPKERSCVDQILKQFFDLDEDGFYFQKRVLEEIARCSKISEKRREAAAKSVQSRQQKTNIPTPTPTPTPILTVSRLEASVMFEDFWRTFPNQTGKGDALPAYVSALAITDHATIMAALKKQLPALEKEKFPPPTPTKWLRAERWHDAPPKPKDNYAGF